MTADLVLSVLHEPSEGLGFLAGFAITDKMIIAAGGVSNRAPTFLASSNARHFEPRKTPRELGLRDVLAVGEVLWTCGEYGQLAVSRDHGASWKQIDTATDACLYGLAQAHDGAVWAVGDKGYAARVVGDQLERVDLATTARLTCAYARKDEIVILGFDGVVRRWRNGTTTAVATGSTKPITAVAWSRVGTWIVVGDGGFVGRSPDGTWFSKVKTDITVDVEAVATLADGRLVAVGDRGTVAMSSDEGRSWKALASGTTAHLWAVEAFGGGAIIGGDDGLVVKIAPAGDETWSDRVNVFGGAHALDAVFGAGPDGFIVNGLAAYLEVIELAREESTGEEVDATFDDGDDADDADEVDDDEDGDDDDEDDDDDDGGDDDDGDDADEVDEDEDDDGDDDDGDDDDDDDEGDDDSDATRLLSAPGDGDSFEAAYGVPLPPEAASFFQHVDGRDRFTTFAQLRVDVDLLPQVDTAHNLFELLLGSDRLVEVFSGTFGIGSVGNGDPYMMELYAWDGPRQILHFDREAGVYSGIVADSLDSLVYLTSIANARAATKISDEAFDIAIRKLRAKATPAWQVDLDLIALEPKHRDTEFLFYRSRWLVALLRNELDEVADLFATELNTIVAADQLPARFDACERIVPTALYSLWRAFLFGEPELARYLEIARRHKARIVRDAAKLVDELRAGRDSFGDVDDAAGWLAAFRKLDLDPRRASIRAAEAEQRARREALRAGELASVTPEGWPDLAWRWLDDGPAHRALLERFDGEPRLGAQIAALDELRALRHDERAVTLPRLAGELAPELEALLVGSLVHGDSLEGVLERPEAPRVAKPKPPKKAKTAKEDASPGWDAIDAALAPIYRGSEPKHFGTVVPYMLGGNDPLHGISAYLRDQPVPHFHFVTYGFTDLFVKETDDPDESGFGFELTMRLARQAGEVEPPIWALNFLQNLARYVFSTGNRFASGHKMGLNGPIALTYETKITAITFADDPELGDIESEFGKARFIQIVGITDDEYRLVQEWSTTGLVDILRKKLPMLVTDLVRDSVLADPVLAAEVRHRVDTEGSLEDMSFGGYMQLQIDDDDALRIELGALYAAAIPRAMRGRIRHGRDYELRGRSGRLFFKPADAFAYRRDGDSLVLELPQDLAAAIDDKLRPNLAGEYHFATTPELVIVLTPTFIRDPQGQATDVKGIGDPAEVARMIEAENARLKAESLPSEDDEDEDGEEDDDDDEDDDLEDDDLDDDDDDDAPPRADRIIAALAMTTRALRLAPRDPDVQLTHAMLSIDADRAEIDDKLDELLNAMHAFEPPVRISIAVRLGDLEHARFADAVDIVLADALPAKILSEGSAGMGGAMMLSYGDVAHELFGELGDHVLRLAPDRMPKLVPMLPDAVALLAEMAWKAIQAKQTEIAISLYDRLLALPIPDEGEDRTNYLRAINNACVQAHSAKAFDAAVRIADRAQPVAIENPYIYHSAACAYAAVGDYSKAFEQVKLAVAHDYDHLAKVEVDSDLGPLLEWPSFKELFRDWHARQEGN